jgi:hypothetical protein
MDIIDILQAQPPRRQDAPQTRPRKRNSDELTNEEDDGEVRDVKPGEEAILRARLHDLQVSTPRDTLSRLADEIASGQGHRETSEAVQWRGRR